MAGKSNTKEIKKKHTSRPVGGAEMGTRAERTHSKAAAGGPSKVADCGTGQAKLQLADPTMWWWQTLRPHFRAQKNRDKRQGVKQTS